MQTFGVVIVFSLFWGGARNYVAPIFIFARLGAPTWLMTNGDGCPIVKFLA